MRALRETYVRLGTSDGRLLLAVSGGPDSMALLLGTAEVAAALHLQTEVACVDHGLRPESPQEVRRVEALAARLGLRFHPLEAKIAPGPGVEARAREARYAALERARVDGGLRWIATAHTASDQAETLLMRLLRGTSIKGARGIHQARGPILRPLLGATREEVMSFLSERAADLQLADDAMNRDPRFLRARVRGRALPALCEAAGEGAAEVVRRLARFAAFAAEDESLLAGMAEDALARLSIVTTSYDGVLERAFSGGTPRPGALDAAGLLALHPAVRRRALSLWLIDADLGVNAAQLERLEGALRSGRPVEVGQRRQALVAGGALRLAPLPGEPAREPPLPLAPGAPVAHTASGQLVALDRSPMEEASAILPLELFPDRPLELRTRLPGDRVRQGRRHRKLQDAFVDLKVPGEWRDRVPVVAEQGGDVLWIVGFWPCRAGTARSGWYLSARPLYDRGEASKRRPRRL